MNHHLHHRPFHNLWLLLQDLFQSSCHYLSPRHQSEILHTTFHLFPEMKINQNHVCLHCLVKLLPEVYLIHFKDNKLNSKRDRKKKSREKVHNGRLTKGTGAGRQQIFLCSLREVELSKSFKQRSQPRCEKIVEHFAFGNGPK